MTNQFALVHQRQKCRPSSKIYFEVSGDSNGMMLASHSKFSSSIVTAAYVP